MRRNNSSSPVVQNENIENSEVYVDEYVKEEIESEGIEASTTETEPIHRRDELGEVRKMSSKDTTRLRLWRIVVTSVILLTAFAVTFTTYTLLKQQEDENFKTAVGLLLLPAFLCRLHEYIILLAFST